MYDEYEENTVHYVLTERATELDGHADWLREFAIRKSFHLDRARDEVQVPEKITAAVALAEFLRRDAARLRKLAADSRQPVAETRHLKIAA